MRSSVVSLVGVALWAAAVGCGDDPDRGAESLRHSLFVAHEGALVSYDIATGEERPGTVQDVTGPVDLHALDDGTLLVNLTGRNEILVVDGKTMLEQARLPSSSLGATRPVHGYVTPVHGGRRYWMALNDGANNQRDTNSARFVDITPGSPTYLQPVGEVRLGIGHHKAAFSKTQARVVISNIADCDNVLAVYDYSDPSNIQVKAIAGAQQLGWDGASQAKTCDPTFAAGAPPAPHGCTTSAQSGKVYCSLTASGDVVAVDLDADTPTFTVIPTGGDGAGYMKAGPGGRYVYGLHESPREDSTSRPGAGCQIGQLVVVDASTDTVVRELPLGYTGPGCTRTLAGTDEATVGPSHITVSPDGSTLYISTAGGFRVSDARSRQQLVVDVSDPRSPMQLPSIPVGQSSDHHGDALSGDGAHLFVTNNVDNTVTHINAASRTVVRTIRVQTKPLAVTTFGSAEGASAPVGPVH